MKKSTIKALAVMIAVLVVLVVIIIILAAGDRQEVPPEKMGDTILAEQAAQRDDYVPPQGSEEPQTPAEPTEVDLPNEKEVRLYVDNGGVMELVTSYDSIWSPDADIAIFEAFNSEEQSIYYDNYFTVHEYYWNLPDTDTEYKIGYELTLTVNGEERVYTILEPADISGNPDLFMGDAAFDEVTGYMGVWVYNDIGHDSTYIHLTQADMTADTLMTSIKLRPTPQMDQVSACRLKVFSYSSQEEFNSQGRYIGTHGYEITVNNR